MRKYLLAFLAMAFLPSSGMCLYLNTVKITTGTALTPTLQTGTMNVSSGTVISLTAASLTSNSGVYNGSVIISGNLTASGTVLLGSAAHSITTSSTTILPGATFYASGPVGLGQSGISVNISSNAVVPGATFYSGGPITMGQAGVSVQISSNTVLPGATFYQGAPTLISSATFTTITVSSNTILPGATFYQGAAIDMSNAPSVNASTYTILGTQLYGIFQSSTVFDQTGSSATTLSTFIPTKTAVTLTPKRASSRIEVSFSGVLQTANGATSAAYATIFRGSTNIVSGTLPQLCIADDNSAVAILSGCSATVIDMPGTASPVTYTVEIRGTNPGTVTTWNPNGETATITVKEWSY